MAARAGSRGGHRQCKRLSAPRAAKHQGISTGVSRQDKARDLPVAEIADEADAGDVAGGREERRDLVHGLPEGAELAATAAPSATSLAALTAHDILGAGSH
jgi:hypothetical protein